MLFDPAVHLGGLLVGLDRLDVDERAVATRAEVPERSNTYAMPPLMPAAKLRPVRPSTTTRPPVMYSQP
jgi:hypothetical protein